MCGIFGLWHIDFSPLNPMEIEHATNTIRHRGPDDEGYVFFNTHDGRFLHIPRFSESLSSVILEEVEANLAFGFRRLAILDLTPAGHQPMSSTDGNFWIIFNGEIYNYIELRTELQSYGYVFRSNSDTEVILAAFQTWGPNCLKRFNGMWAFALFDLTNRRLFCSRDRFGIKPFYYFWDGTTFAFASEIKALLNVPGLPRIPNDAIIYDYLAYNLLDHTEETFFSGIKQIPPAHNLILSEGNATIQSYWQIPVEPIKFGKDTAEGFYHLFEDAVRIHLRSDVPIGTCLSGGLDSSAVVCVANQLLFNGRLPNPEQIGKQQKTFSSCAEDPLFDERQYIEQVITSTNTERNYVFPNPKDLLENLPSLIWHQDEPFGSLSIYAQWSVMRLAAERGVRVLLDGQGSDEMLAGYHSYFDALWAHYLRRGEIGKLWKEWRAYMARFGSQLPLLFARSLRPFAPPELIAVARHLRRGRNFGYTTLGVNSEFDRSYSQRVYVELPGTAPSFDSALRHSFTRLSLPKLLHYEDRNSMAFSIEARVPFLDVRLVEFVFSLPVQDKIHLAVTKVVLRQAMQGILPETVRQRVDKMGFVTPEKTWLSTDLYPWAQEIIYSDSFRCRPYFNVKEIEHAMRAHASGRLDLTALAWRWLNLELWLRAMIEQVGDRP